LQNFFHWYILQSWKLKRPQVQLRPHYFWTYASNLTTVVNSVPASPAYGVYISQLIRYARASINYSDFLKRHLYLRNRLLDQGYKKIRLIRSLKKFIFRYQDIVEIYSVSCRDNGERWIFIKWKCIKIRRSTTMSKIYFLSMCDVRVFLTFTFVVKIL
jgi:hypothetical protein